MLWLTPQMTATVNACVSLILDPRNSSGWPSWMLEPSTLSIFPCFLGTLLAQIPRMQSIRDSEME